MLETIIAVLMLAGLSLAGGLFTIYLTERIIKASEELEDNDEDRE